MVKLIKRKENIENNESHSTIMEDKIINSPEENNAKKQTDDTNVVQETPSKTQTKDTSSMSFTELVLHYNKNANTRVNDKGDIEVGWP